MWGEGNEVMWTEINVMEWKREREREKEKNDWTPFGMWCLESICVLRDMFRWMKTRTMTRSSRETRHDWDANTENTRKREKERERKREKSREQYSANREPNQNEWEREREKDVTKQEKQNERQWNYITQNVYSSSPKYATHIQMIVA